MFYACLEAGCSPSYQQELAGSDTCTVEGGGTMVSVEAGGSCAFSASGSCYVLCSCPEGTSVQADVDEPRIPLENSEIQETEDRLGGLEAALAQLQDKQAQDKQEIMDLFDSMQSENDATHAEQYAEMERQKLEVSEIQNQTDNLQDQIDSAQLSLEAMQQAITDLNAANIGLQDQINQQGDLITDLQAQIDALKATSGLVVSRYTVDCNSVNLTSLNDTFSYYSCETWGCGTSVMYNRACVLVDDVDSTDIPFVQVYQDNTMMFTDYKTAGGGTFSWLSEFQAEEQDGSYQNAGNGDISFGPAYQLRYDSTTKQIYTAGYYTSTTTSRNYNVVVYGSKAYVSGY